MARQPRIDLPGIAQHVVQRGNNRLPCFLDNNDRHAYLHYLTEALQDSDCKLHGWVLMSNHVHLLVTPSAAGAIGVMMQRLGRNYVQLFNRRHGRTGTLWEGRYKASLVGSDCYLLQCLRYIELNPVRAAIVDDPAVYPWSSCRDHLGMRLTSLTTPHPTWLATGNSAAERAIRWRRFLGEAITEHEMTAIRTTLQQQRVFGSSAFLALVQARTKRFAGTRPAHRPARNRSQETGSGSVSEVTNLIVNCYKAG